MKRLILAAAVTVTAAILSPTPADAAGGAIFRHYSPDDGYDPPIRFRCNNGEEYGLPEGATSSGICLVRAIYIRPGEEAWAKVLVGGYWQWRKKFDATGWYGVDDGFDDGLGLTLRVD